MDMAVLPMAGPDAIYPKRWNSDARQPPAKRPKDAPGTKKQEPPGDIKSVQEAFEPPWDRDAVIPGGSAPQRALRRGPVYQEGSTAWNTTSRKLKFTRCC
jgi:hypothetical protein